jgi:hypothetical protein
MIPANWRRGYSSFPSDRRAGEAQEMPVLPSRAGAIFSSKATLSH